MQGRAIITNNVIRMKEPAVVTWLLSIIEIQNMTRSLLQPVCMLSEYIHLHTLLTSVSYHVRKYTMIQL